MIGQTISHYKVTDKLGEGGMGVVYKAEDIRLKRTVALKFLPRQATANSDDKDRFTREAQAVASLDHPNICTVYEIDEVEGQSFLAMAYIDGRSLDQRIQDGPLPLTEALDIAIQIAEGLQSAHAKSVVHRDIKAANIMLAQTSKARPQVKIMDFGLAQVANRSKLTQPGARMGTIAYMSPEQTQGRPVDHRTDLWSLGVVLYEMLTGELPFGGHYEQAVLYSILNEQPEPVTAKRARLPMELEWILPKALAKNPDERYQSANDLLVDLQNLRKKVESGMTAIQSTVVTPATQLIPPPIAQPQPKSGWERKAFYAAAVVAALSLALLAVAWLGSGETPEAPAQVRRYSIQPPSAAAHGGVVTGVSISPTGEHIAFTTAGTPGRLWIQDRDHFEPHALDDADGAQGHFWSPDGEWIAYAIEGQLKKVRIHGGPTTPLCALPGLSISGGSWSPDGQTIIFASGSPPQLFEVAALGGNPRPATESGLMPQDGPPPGGPPGQGAPPEPPPFPPPGEGRKAGKREMPPAGLAGGRGRGPRSVTIYPSFLPLDSGKRAFLFSSRGPEGFDIRVSQGADQPSKVIGRGIYARYSATGHIVYQIDQETHEIWAMPFSLETLTPTGDPFPVAQNARLPSVSRDGSLVYLESPGSGMQQLVWRDRQGVKLDTVGGAQRGLRDPALSPDGNSLAVSIEENGNLDLWLIDLNNGARTRLTFDPGIDARPIWGPGKGWITFSSRRDNGNDFFRIAVDSGREAEPFPGEGEWRFALTWSPDGRSLLYMSRQSDGGGMRVLQPEGDSWKSTDFSETHAFYITAEFSPNGRFIVYAGNESGRDEIYVRPFPEGTNRWQVSQDSGNQPSWNGDGSEIYFVRENTLMAATVSTAEGFRLFDVKPLFENLTLGVPGPGRRYAAHPGGEKFLLIEPHEEAADPPVRVVLNWYEEFRK